MVYPTQTTNLRRVESTKGNLLLPEEAKKWVMDRQNPQILTIVFMSSGMQVKPAPKKTNKHLFVTFKDVSYVNNPSMANFKLSTAK